MLNLIMFLKKKCGSFVFVIVLSRHQFLCLKRKKIVKNFTQIFSNKEVVLGSELAESL